MRLDSAVDQKVRVYERNIIKNNIEYAASFDLQGNLINQVTGNRNTVSIADLGNIRNLIVTHNHVRGSHYCFSHTDVNTAVKYNVYMIRAVGFNNGVNWLTGIERNPVFKLWPNDVLFETKVSEILIKAYFDYYWRGNLVRAWQQIISNAGGSGGNLILINERL